MHNDQFKETHKLVVLKVMCSMRSASLHESPRKTGISRSILTLTEARESLLPALQDIMKKISTKIETKTLTRPW